MSWSIGMLQESCGCWDLLVARSSLKDLDEAGLRGAVVGALDLEKGGEQGLGQGVGGAGLGSFSVGTGCGWMALLQELSEYAQGFTRCTVGYGGVWQTQTWGTGAGFVPIVWPGGWRLEGTAAGWGRWPAVLLDAEPQAGGTGH